MLSTPGSVIHRFREQGPNAQFVPEPTRVLGIPNSRHGAALRKDAAASLGEHVLAATLRDGLLAQPWRGVVIDGRRTLDPLTRASAALLACGPGAVLSRETAAALHGCTVVQSPEVHVTVPYSRWVRSRSGLIVHHDRFVDDDVETCHGMPVMELELAIADLLCTQRRWVALACLDQALAGRSDQQVGAFVAAVDRRLAVRDDRRGILQAESLLCLGTSGADSPQESRLRLLVIDAGFPIPVTQHRILTLSGELIYKLDIAWPELRIALEYDGYEAHEGREEYDSERDRRMVGRGWRVIRVRKEDLVNPEPFLAQLRQAFADRHFSIST